MSNLINNLIIRLVNYIQVQVHLSYFRKYGKISLKLLI